jgi:hypothetical protein
LVVGASNTQSGRSEYWRPEAPSDDESLDLAIFSRLAWICWKSVWVPVRFPWNNAFIATTDGSIVSTHWFEWRNIWLSSSAIVTSDVGEIIKVFSM